MTKYQVRYKLIDTNTNSIILQSILYSTYNSKKRLLFNDKKEAIAFMKNVEKTIMNISARNFKLDYEIFDEKIKLKINNKSFCCFR